jgi:signal transduction histidine kinase
MPIAKTQFARFRLRTILLFVYLLVLIVPIGSIYAFRLYENELVRQTEIELIAQGSYITASYKQAIHTLIRRNSSYGIPALIPPQRLDEKYTIIRPELDVASAEIYPPRPDGIAHVGVPDTLALRASKAIFPIIDEATLTTLAGVRITDYRGVVVAGRDEVGLSLAHVEEVSQALKGQYTSRLRQRISNQESSQVNRFSRVTGMRLFVAMPILDQDRVLGVVLLSRSPRTILKGLQDEQHRMIIATSMIVGITILLALLTSYTISRPIHALIRQTQRIARGERDIQAINVPVTQELALLSHNISRMAETIAQRSDYIRNFAMHLSHEFKTPLTAIQGAIELIQEHGRTMPAEQQHKFLSNITQDTTRLKILVSRLLELARADVTEPRNESTDFHNLLKILHNYYHDRNISIIDQDTTGIFLLMPEDITRTILGNLIENSIQHGATIIKIHAIREERRLQIRIHDNGKGISPANACKLFTPFFTTKREQGGTGLGLTMVRSLLTAYHAEICYVSQEYGACFEISFPNN